MALGEGQLGEPMSIEGETPVAAEDGGHVALDVLGCLVFGDVREYFGTLSPEVDDGDHGEQIGFEIASAVTNTFPRLDPRLDVVHQASVAPVAELLRWKFDNEVLERYTHKAFKKHC